MIGETVHPADFRAGLVALVGKPNVGKSTLMNVLLGEKVAIVSPLPQTTRVPLRGILNSPQAQVIFIDTPGIHKPRHELGEMMVRQARRTIPDADIACMMVDISKPPSKLDRMIAAEISNTQVPRLLLLNKVDLRPQGGSHQQAYQELGTWDMELALSAYKQQGLEALLAELIKRLPVSPPLYPEEWLVDQSEQFLASEIVREKVLYMTRQEVPHAVAIEVDEWEEREEQTYIRMSINVEKESQKGILIGAKGAMLKRIGTAARADIEQMHGRAVYLDLWVKVRPHWRDDPSSLGWLGYQVKG
jgi:GTP-binding protein Era